MAGIRSASLGTALNLLIGTLPPSDGLPRENGVMRVAINSQRHITGSELSSAFGHSGHGRNCCSLDPVAIDPKLTIIDLDQL
jgi:hypothetical protein